MSARWLLVGIAGALLFIAPSVTAFNPNGRHWPAKPVVMYLGQASTGVALMDGSPDWDAVSENALNTWNTVLNGVSFAAMRDPAAESGLPNDTNNVIWGDDVYGEPFGEGVLAITTSLYTVEDNTTVEADVIFNRKYTWNSYRGGLQRKPDGSVLIDMRRVAIHEFGHVLGLDHPDDAGQSVSAIMNSHTSDLEMLQQDDIDGVASIYGARAAGTGDPNAPLPPGDEGGEPEAPLSTPHSAHLR